MIIKIQPPSDMLTATLYYNERKADGQEGIDRADVSEESEEKGHILATRNIPEDSTLAEEFERLELLNRKKSKGRKLENPAFHMSVNPGNNDAKLTEAQIVEFVDEIMLQLGYGESPYRIYKHTDIERTHYHVVSSRIGQDGTKISDSYENRRVIRVAESLAEKYGYTVGLDERQSKEIEETKDKGKKDTKKNIVRPFSQDTKTPISEMFQKYHEETMKWSFSTPEQYMAIMRWRFNCDVEEQEDGFTYAGLDRNGETCTPRLNEKDLGLNTHEKIIEKCTNADIKKKKRQKERIEKTAEEAIKDCSSFKEFRKRMNEKGIFVVISYTEDGDAFGLTWLDIATKCAFKGSDTKTDLKWLKDKASIQSWTLMPYHRHDRRHKKRNLTKSRYRAGNEIKRQIEQKKAEALRRQILNDNDQTSSKQAIDKTELKDDPNNIKI